MASKKPVELALTAEQRAAVDAALGQRELAPRVRERLEMVKAVALGHDLPQITQWSGRSARTVRRWLAQYATGGPAALADRPRTGRPTVADAMYREAAEAALTTGPRALGLPFDVWTTARLATYLEEQTGRRLAVGWLRALLGQWGYVYGRPKHTLRHLQDATAVAACAEEWAATAHKSGGGPRALRAAL
jgi:transposase